MAERSRLPAATLTADARNRAWRTLLQTAAASVLVLVLPALIGWANGGDLNWRLLAGAAATTAGAPIVAFVQRRYLDPSGVASAVPPGDPVA